MTGEGDWTDEAEGEMTQEDEDLLAASAAGDVNGAEAALAAGADPNAQTEPVHTGMRTAIHEAAVRGHAAVIRALAAAGADVNARASSLEYPAARSFTALHLAAQGGDEETVRALLELGADPSLKGEGELPLHTAAREGRPEIVRLLLDGGAKVDAGDQHRWTPLIVAADAVQHCKSPDRAFPEVVRLLLAAGAKPDAVNHGNQSALTMLKPRNRKRPDPPHMIEQRDQVTTIIREALAASPKPAARQKSSAPIPPPSPPMDQEDSEEALPHRRGVFNFEAGEVLVLVRAPIHEVTPAFRKHRGAEYLLEDALGKPVEVSDPSFLIYQLTGHPWTIIDTYRCDHDASLYVGAADAAELSRALDTHAIFYANSDTAGATRYELFDRGATIQMIEVDGGIEVANPEGLSRLPETTDEAEACIDLWFREQDAFAPGWSTALGGWRHPAGARIMLDLGGVVDRKDLVRLDFVALKGA